MLTLLSPGPSDLFFTSGNFYVENVYPFGKSFEKFTVFLSQRDGPATAEQKGVHVDLCMEVLKNQYIK